MVPTRKPNSCQSHRKRKVAIGKFNSDLPREKSPEFPQPRGLEKGKKERVPGLSKDRTVPPMLSKSLPFITYYYKKLQFILIILDRHDSTVLKNIQKDEEEA